MLKRLSPNTLRAVPERYQGIYVHGTQIASPSRFVFLSGQIGVAPDGTTHASFKEQCNQAIDNVEALLADAEMTTADILRVTYFVTDPDHLASLSEVRQARWNQGTAPAVTTLVVAALAAPDLLVEIEVTAAK
ncbi:RidA family protein [Roseobacter sp. MH60115]|uniref:RidA family protein n=1 Tax=Roseobacter sp. MH60115 TaxID=2785324 RepID=UPI0018A33A32|nr:RidA family protein [Roseobacter sp. MH60115]